MNTEHNSVGLTEEIMAMPQPIQRASEDNDEAPYEPTNSTFTDLMNLNLAWRRLKQDRPDRAFTTHPFAIDLIELNLEGWLSAIRTDLIAGYTPQGCVCFNVPKPNWLARPGAALDLADEVAFNAIVGFLHPLLWARLGPLQGSHDIAYQLSEHPGNLEWILKGFKVWRQWREKSLSNLRQGTQYVLFADIAAFYENIDLHRLKSDINSLKANRQLIEVLMKCLHQWAHPRGKGIPQGYSASDLLAKLYMNPVDQALKNENYCHLRYVDDIRVFCRSLLEAKQALLKLNELLRHRGLNLQSAKTYILRAEEARNKIDGVTPTIEAINIRIRDEIVAIAGDMGYPVTLDDLQQFTSSHPDAPPVEVLERAFEESFSSASSNFDKTLLHYLLTRLAKCQSRIAVDYCLDLIQRRPEETRDVLRYFAGIGVQCDKLTGAMQYLESADSIFDYQRFEVIRWHYENNSSSDDLIRVCRKWAFDRNRDPYLRAFTIAALGRWGNEADLEQIENTYPNAANDLERAEIICSLKCMESSRRNAFYGRVRESGEMVGRAVRWARQPG